MAGQDQLEVISSRGDIRFHALDVVKGLTNIGRHPDNDVVLEGSQVGLFHAVLDHRQKPYHLMVLSPEARIRVRGETVMQGTAELHPWDLVEIDQYSLMVVEGTSTAAPASRIGSPSAVAATAMPVPVVPVVAPATLPAATPGAAPVPAATPSMRPSAAPPTPPAAPPPVVTAAVEADSGETGASSEAQLDALLDRLVDLPADQKDELILADFVPGDFGLDAEKKALDFSVEVKQSATFTATLGNGGDIVATFEVQVLGIDREWVSNATPMLNLNEGERAVVKISITPPRAPTSRAGAHYFAVVVTSPNYPGRRHVTNGALLIKPYQEFTVGELSPKEQTISFNKRFGVVTVPVINKGNGDEMFRVEAEDNARACTFEFDGPDGVAQARMLEVAVPSNSTLSVPVRLAPLKKDVVSFGSRSYSFTVSVGLMNGQQTPRTLMGQARSTPLIGPILIILIVLSILGLIVWFSWPRIQTFEATDPAGKVFTAGAGVEVFLNAGETTTLKWQASPFFIDLKLVDEKSGAIINEVGASSQPAGSLVFSPTDNINYKLVGTTFLSQLSPMFTASGMIPVVVKPVFPNWVSYTGGAKTLVRGESVAMTWKVDHAETVILITRINNVDTRTPLPAEQTREGTLTLTPTGSVTYILEARNRYTGDNGVTIGDPLVITLLEPTATPLPSPVIERFDVAPAAITAGMSVKVDWTVSGVVAGITKITINGTEASPSGSLEFFPTENTVYTIVAVNGDKRSEQSKSVTVSPPPPPPVAPKVEFFTATPATVVQGSVDAAAVKLSWSVTGDTTNIKISSPDLGEIVSQPKQGTMTVSVTKVTQFVLTAYNGDLSTSQTVQVMVLIPTATPPPTATPLPLPVVNVSAAAELASAASRVVQLPSGDPTIYKFRVVAGTSVRFSWTASNATQVTFAGVQKLPSDSYTIKIVDQNQTSFQLDAVNAAGVHVLIGIAIELAPKPVPPAPFNVNGPIPSGSPPITISWSYDSNYLIDIAGFRVYKSVANAPFAPAVDLAISPYQWLDTNGACGMGYYVVAVYVDLDGTTKESPPSTNSWYSQLCPVLPVEPLNIFAPWAGGPYR